MADLENKSEMIPIELSPYPAYKSSGVEWLGDVPAHWEVKRLKNWLEVNQITLPENTDPDYTFDYLDIGAVGTGRLTAKPEKIRFGASPSRARRVVRPGDTIVSTVRTYLKAVWHAEDANTGLIASTGFAVLTPKRETSPKFVSYVCQSDPFTNRVTAESVGIAYPAIAETRLGTFDVCIPPFPEQTAIVRFLDHADRRIRRYIRAKQKLITLLEEQNRAIIHQAVTGQVDVRTGQPYPAYKPSGIEWLGKLPGHWEVRRLKHAAALNPSRTESRSSLVSDTAVTFLPMERVSADGRIDPQETLPACKAWNGFTYFRRGDVLVAKITPCFENGKGAHLHSLPTAIGFGSTEFHVLRAKSFLLPQFLYRLTTASEFRRRGTDAMTGAAGQQRVPPTFIANYPISLPTRFEQAAIVAYLDKATADIDTAIARTRCQIELLQEYHARLIADVVTGKLEVREDVHCES